MNGDPPGTEYSDGLRGLEAYVSFAHHHGVSVGEAADLLLSGKAAPVIQRRNAQKKKADELRAAGFVSCSRCGGSIRPGMMCECGEFAPSSRLSGAEAELQIWRRRLAPG